MRRPLLALLLCASFSACYPWGKFQGPQEGCPPGFAHCPGAPVTSDGGAQVCETPLNTAQDCGACGLQCVARCGAESCITPVSLALGSDHTCALMSDGTVTCWGKNDQGQLGQPPERLAQSALPVPVPGVEGAVEVAAGHELSCALLAGGTVLCWGRDNESQLGVGDAGVPFIPTPTPVAHLTDATGLWAANANVCARRRDGQLLCWGHNANGQVVFGQGGSVDVPTRIEALPDAGVVQVAIAHETLCALVDDGSVWCWGSNAEGLSGDGTFGVPRRPTRVPSLSGVTELVAGRHVCAALDGGSVVCWGRNVMGELGNGDAGAPVPTPTPVEGLTHSSRITAAEEVSCAIRDGDETVFCWGDNSFGQLGALAAPSSAVRVAVPGTAFRQLRTGGYHSCGLTSVGSVWCWGQNNFGELGLGQASTTSVTVPTLVRW